MVATKPIDFRKGHDSLDATVKKELRKDPFTGTGFVFRAKRADWLNLFVMGLHWLGDYFQPAGRTHIYVARPEERDPAHARSIAAEQTKT